MRIDKVKKTTSLKTKSVKKPSAKSDLSFTDLMDDAEGRRSHEHLEQMMEKIEQEGQKLSDSKTVETLIVYKKMVREFVTEAVESGLNIKDKRGRSRLTRSKVLKIVSVVDSKLIELTDEFLAKERKQIRLLEKIGELQGLLVNLMV